MKKVLNVLIRDCVLNRFVSSSLLPYPLRWRLLRCLGANVQRSQILASCWMESVRLSIGEGSFINYGCRFENNAPVTIGQRVNVGPEVCFMTATHEFGEESRRAGRPMSAAITVDDGVWIGARVLLLPGVRVGRGAVIAAGAVVAKDCQPNGLYAGTPAALQRML